MKTILLLFASNVFMTIAWYGHLKFRFLEGKPMFFVILVSWGIAFFEYCLMVPANRSGYFNSGFSGYQLKIIQEAVTLTVFSLFAWIVLRERLTWNYAVSFFLVILAVYFATAFKPTIAPPSGH
ncbi:MAG TPA: DMT family protein [Opitutaceae bacterium]|nr:DMT family protein [Opitutaceae bacterium]